MHALSWGCLSPKSNSTAPAHHVPWSGIDKVLEEPGVQMRIFGKPEVKGHRRMAVILATDTTVEAAREKAARAYDRLTITTLPRE